jgi:hypothetical protein
MYSKEQQQVYGYLMDPRFFQRGKGLPYDGKYQGKSFKGEGWKKGIGATLIGLSAIGTPAAMSNDPVSALIGGAILGGIGGLLMKSDNKKQSGKGYNRQTKSFDKFFETAVKTELQKGSGVKQITKKQIKNLIDMNKNKQIHVSDIFGKDWKKKGKILIKAIEQHKRNQEGQGVFDDIGKFAKKTYKKAKTARDKAIDKLKDFAAGKTKFKPSTLMDIAAGAVGIAGMASAFIPAVDIISVPAASALSLGLKSGAHLLKTSGRGMKGKGAKTYKNIGDEYKEMIIKPMADTTKSKNKKGGALMLAGQRKYGKGVGLAGGAEIPEYIKKFVSNYPQQTKKMIEMIQMGGTIGAGKGKKLAKALGFAVSMASTVYKIYKFLQNHPEILDKVLSFIESGLKSYLATGMGKNDKYMKKMMKHDKYMKKHPDVTKMIATFIHKGQGIKLSGSGKASKFAAALGIAGTSAAAGAYGLYQYLLNNPSIAAKIAAKGAVSIGSKWLGSGTKLAGGADELPYGVSYTKTGKIKRDRYSVYYGFYNKTSSGLTKADFVKKGKKIISRKKQEQGRKNARFLNK